MFINLPFESWSRYVPMIQCEFQQLHYCRVCCLCLSTWTAMVIILIWYNYAGTNAFVHCEIWFPKKATKIKDRQLFPQLWFCLRIIFFPEIWWFERLKLGDGGVGCGLLSYGRQSRRRHHPGGVLSSSTPRRWGRFGGWPKSSSISARGGLVSLTKSWGKSDKWCILIIL